MNICNSVVNTVNLASYTLGVNLEKCKRLKGKLQSVDTHCEGTVITDVFPDYFDQEHIVCCLPSKFYIWFDSGMFKCITAHVKGLKYLYFI